MYVSFWELDWKHARNPYDLHRALWHGFPDFPPGSDRPFLFCVRWGKFGQPVQVRMQSETAPVQPDDGTIRLLKLQPYQPRPATGQLVRFTLCANPVKRLTEKTGPDDAGRQARVPLIREEQRLDWLVRQLSPAVEVLESNIVEWRDLFFTIPREQGQGRAGKHATVTFTGVGEVRDPDRLTGLLKNGVGPAKAFGCGLLVLNRA